MYRLMLISTLAILAQIPENTNARDTDPSALGCWKDDIPRALPLLEGKSSVLDNEHYTTRENPVAKCAKAAAEKGYKVFAVQDGGQCFSSDDAKSTYKKYGSSTACIDQKGGPMANSVYEMTKPLKCYSCKDCTDTGVEMDCTVPNDSCSKVTLDGKIRRGCLGLSNQESGCKRSGMGANLVEVCHCNTDYCNLESLEVWNL